MISSNLSGLEVAVIGMSLRVPGANNIFEFWDNLKKGVESISFFTEQQLEENSIPLSVIRNPNYVGARGIVDNLNYFDHKFFRYTPKEAMVMDPQLRILHECAWDSLENAGYNTEKYNGLIGSYIGAQTSINWVNCLLNGENKNVDVFEAMTLVGSQFFSTRISYNFDLKGPSNTIQTACSSSLISIIQACQSLLSGDCDMALAGGVSVNLPQETGYLYKYGTIKSKDGHCRAFDSNASGTVSGNGVGIVVLKRLEDAIEDGDNIFAIVKGYGINNDGARKAGFTAPSIDGQVASIRSAQQMAEVEPESIGYIEAHGTGTIIGDPIEVKALKLAFNSEERQFCALGSVKTNIGHLDSAAGVVGFIKTVLALNKKVIPPSLNFEKANEQIDFNNSPFYVNNKTKEWKKDNGPLRAGVSSFGIGGTNAHIILEEFREERKEQSSETYKIMPISAKTKEALEKYKQNMLDYLKENSEINLDDICHTMKVGRREFNYRDAVVFNDRNEAIKILSLRKQNKSSHSNFIGKNKFITFMFPGQGAQYSGMAKELYNSEPVFRYEVDKCLDIVQKLIDEDLKEIILSNDEELGNKLKETHLTQPAIFIIEYALAKLMMKIGIKPNAMIGHSVGEYVAACISGVFTLDDAIKVIVKRGELMRKIARGAMLAVASSEEKIESLANEEISIAAINSPNRCTVSGEIDAINRFMLLLDSQEIKYRLLHTPHAYHSYMVEPILDDFRDVIKSVKLSTPQIPYISNVTGSWVKEEEIFDTEYWARHLYGTVRFSDGINNLLSYSNNIFIEIGPGVTLNTFVREHDINSNNSISLNLTRHSKERVNDMKFFLEQIAQLWSLGVSVDWNKFGSKGKQIPLPTYPFEKIMVNIETNLNKRIKINLEAKSEIEKEISTTKNDDIQKYANESEYKIIQAYKDVLGLYEISVNDNFFQSGGDSLKAVNLLGILSRNFNVTLENIFEFTNAEELAKNITLKKDGLKEELELLFDNTEDDSIRERTDEIHDSDNYFNKVYEEYSRRNLKYDKLNLIKIIRYKHILLTGSTGYVGIYILHDLLKMTDSNIHLIIRGKDKEECEKRLKDKISIFFDEKLYDHYRSRISIYKGDISNENLGITLKEYKALSKIVDCIINSGGISSHFGDYSTFEAVNVKGFENIIKFAKVNLKKDIQQISTMGVARGDYRDISQIMFTEYDYDLGQENANYYIKSKFEAERLLLDARKSGLKINNFRLGNVLFNSENGTFQENIQQNAIYSLMKAFIGLGIVPDMSMHIDVGFVDYISKSVVLLFNREALVNETYHIYNPYNTDLVNIVTKESLNLGVLKKSTDYCKEYLQNNYENPKYASHINVLRTHMFGGSVVRRERHNELRIYCDKTTGVLRKLGLVWCQVNESHMMKMITHCKKVGFI